MPSGPYAVTILRNIIIPARDGVELAATLHLPDGAGPWPAVLTYAPYHKDGSWGRRSVAPVHRFFASHGVAGLTLDVRGTGSSGGATASPYTETETTDGYDAVEWIAAQPWCTGAVGMWGASYGGVTTLSVAATVPPSLRAIVPIHGSADEYDGFFRPHGCRPGFWTEADWGPMMVALNLMPPLYRDDEGRWAGVWEEHLAGNTPWPHSWHTHDVDWALRRANVEKITAPMFAICGWQDYYPGVTLRYFNRATSPKRALIGPWKHTLPDISSVAPMGGLAEMLRWWERWLLGVDNGVDREPPVAIYVQGSNQWRYEHAWPPPASTPDEWFVASGHVLAPENPQEVFTEAYAVDASVGTVSILWDPRTPHIPYDADHGPDDAAALAFTSAPLASDVEICGDPEATVWISTAQNGLLVGKLCAIAPDGHSTLICRGWREIEATQPGEPETAETPREYTISLDATAFVVPQGHRIRLTIAGADFPLLWPTPERVALTVHASPDHPSRISLPLRPRTGDERVPNWLPAESFPPAAGMRSDDWHVTRDLVQRSVAVRHQAETVLPLDGNARLTMRQELETWVDPGNPRYARMTGQLVATLHDDSFPVVVNARTVQTTRALDINARVTLADQVIYDRIWHLPLTADGFAIPATGRREDHGVAGEP